MGTEILRPQQVDFPRRKICNYGNSYSNPTSSPKPKPRSSRKLHHNVVRSQNQDQRKRSVGESKTGKVGLVMEKVTILRRGESLHSKIKREMTPRIGESDMVAKQQIHELALSSPLIGDCTVYAGSAFAVSPEPSSLPLPSFSKKKQMQFDDSAATRDLRRLLRLD